MARTIDSVVKDGLCTGCGTCQGVCPQLAIDMVMNRHRGIYVPQVERDRCNECGICFEVCPGHSVDFGLLNSEIFGEHPDDAALGNLINCYVGHATDYDIRYNSASGGLVTSLLVFALEQGLIDGALVSKMSDDRPLEPQPFVARTREEIISASKSKYCPVPANVALREILQKEGRYAVVGLPCHIHGVRKAEALNQKLRNRVVLHLGIFCSHMDNFRMTESVLNKYGVSRDDVSCLDYRGGGWPGSMTIHLRSGKQKLIPVDDYMPHHALGFFVPVRCKLCCDQNSELADISFGDAWLPGMVARDKVGKSIVLSRSEAGEALCRQAVANGHFELEEVASKMPKRWAIAKKRDMTVRFYLSRTFRKPIPEYNVTLPRPRFANCLRVVLTGFNSWIASRRYLRLSVGLLLDVEQSIRSWLGRIRFL